MSFLSTVYQYFFASNPTGPFKFLYVFIAAVVLLVAGAIALKIFLKKHKEDKIFRKLFRDLPGKLFAIAFMEAIYVLVRFERMPYLSMRFLNYLIFAYAAYVAFHYAQLYFKVYPADKKHHEEQLKLNRYLPRKHKKKR